MSIHKYSVDELVNVKACTGHYQNIQGGVAKIIKINNSSTSQGTSSSVTYDVNYIAGKKRAKNVSPSVLTPYISKTQRSSRSTRKVATCTDDRIHVDESCQTTSKDNTDPPKKRLRTTSSAATLMRPKLGQRKSFGVEQREGIALMVTKDHNVLIGFELNYGCGRMELQSKGRVISLQDWHGGVLTGPWETIDTAEYAELMLPAVTASINTAVVSRASDLKRKSNCDNSDNSDNSDSSSNESHPQNKTLQSRTFGVNATFECSVLNNGTRTIVVTVYAAKSIQATFNGKAGEENYELVLRARLYATLMKLKQRNHKYWPYWFRHFDDQNVLELTEGAKSNQSVQYGHRWINTARCLDTEQLCTAWHTFCVDSRQRKVHIWSFVADGNNNYTQMFFPPPVVQQQRVKKKIRGTSTNASFSRHDFSSTNSSSTNSSSTSSSSSSVCVEETIDDKLRTAYIRAQTATLKSSKIEALATKSGKRSAKMDYQFNEEITIC